MGNVGAQVSCQRGAGIAHPLGHPLWTIGCGLFIRWHGLFRNSSASSDTASPDAPLGASVSTKDFGSTRWMVCQPHQYKRPAANTAPIGQKNRNPAKDARTAPAISPGRFVPHDNKKRLTNPLFWMTDRSRIRLDDRWHLQSKLAHSYRERKRHSVDTETGEGSLLIL